jgi:Restriction endonuclease BsobI
MDLGCGWGKGCGVGAGRLGERFCDFGGWLRRRWRRCLYNLTVSIVGNNIDLCLFDGESASLDASSLRNPKLYIALGELKCGIDPAGADEHWKTARSALWRIHTAFERQKLATFFVGAAVETKMAREIWALLENGTINNAANLTEGNQLASLTRWLCAL